MLADIILISKIRYYDKCIISLGNGLDLFFQVSSVSIVEVDYGELKYFVRRAFIMESKLQLQNLAAS